MSISFVLLSILTISCCCLPQVLQIVFVSTPSLIYMGHAMHRVRREEKRRSREEEGGEARGGEDDPGGGGGDDSGGEDEKEGREVPKHEEKGSGGHVRLRGALLQTYVLSILIRSIMEVCRDSGRPCRLSFQPKVTSLHTDTIDPPYTGGVSQSAVFSVRDLPQSSVCLQGKHAIRDL